MLDVGAKLHRSSTEEMGVIHETSRYHLDTTWFVLVERVS